MITTREKTESNMKMEVMKFLRNEEGLTIVEYAVAGALISAAAVAAFTLLGGNVAALINWLAGIITVP